MRGVSITIGSVIAVVIVLAIVMIGLPTYNVYSKQMQGKAAYEQAVAALYGSMGLKNPALLPL